jgi:hypothetical protein
VPPTSPLPDVLASRKYATGFVDATVEAKSACAAAAPALETRMRVHKIR